jgi:ABC-type polysaccharide/polyol phosphate transport system ATPase subunit/GT2 family glycosyltransferase/glycosyltransferase involved in cell wall biosynthesis/uncharacterized coiled-coil protein SlyX
MATVRVRDLNKYYLVRRPRSANPTLREAMVGAVRSRLNGSNGSSNKDILWALRDVSFDVMPGEVVGIIGRNGAGKSTLLKILARITKPSGGEIDIYGRVGSLLEIGTGFHPDLTGRENIYLNATILGMRRPEIRRKLDQIIAFSEVENFLDVPVKHYSSGMYLRLAFAVAAHVEPEVLLLDEVMAVGDVAFQQKCLEKMKEVSREGRAVFFVSHSMEAIQELCTRVFLIEGGRLIERESKEAAIAQYLKIEQANSSDEPKHSTADLSGPDPIVSSEAEQQKTIRRLSQRLVRQQQDVERLQTELAERDRLVQALNRGLNEKNAQFVELTNTLGGFLTYRFLRLYSLYRRIRYPYLLPVYRLLGVTPPVPTIAPTDGIGPLSDLKPPPPLEPHFIDTDIVICVHNALPDVQQCLDSVIRHTSRPYSLILVDDGSEPECHLYLEDFAKKHQITLIRNEHARGYTFAANQGMQRSSADFVVLLNSDTIVTMDWLDRMIACAESDDRIGLVGPLSNAATWQSIPEIIIDGQFAENKLPYSLSAEDLGRLTAQYSARLYPRVPFLNGFCYMIKRRVIEQIGYFDEEAFGRGYGEENDYSLRATMSGWELAVADDAYVYHAGSRSYSHERRAELCKHSGQTLIEKYGKSPVDKGVTQCRWDRVMEGMRARNRVMMTRQKLITEGHSRWSGKKVLFLLPGASNGGGGNVVLDEGEAMREMGVDVTVLNLTQHKFGFEQAYPDNSLPVVFVDHKSQIPELLTDYDAVIATLFKSVDWMGFSSEQGNDVRRGYYVQDFEPHFFPEGSEGFDEAWQSYTRYPDLIRVTKTAWNRDIVIKHLGVDCALVGPSVNIDLHRPRRRKGPEWPYRPLRIAAMIRPSSPHRAGPLTLEILRETCHAHSPSVEIVLFGCEENALSALGVPMDFPYQLFGVLPRARLAALLNEIDVFVDFSHWQAMGLTAMEAMCNGAAVIVPKKGGAESFLSHQENGLMVDTDSESECLSALDRLVTDTELRTHLQRRAIVDICEFFRERAAFNVLNALFATTEVSWSKPSVAATVNVVGRS